MPEPICDSAMADTGGDKVCGMSVPQVMQSNLR
jgi:hypothetical protein